MAKLPKQVIEADEEANAALAEDEKRATAARQQMNAPAPVAPQPPAPAPAPEPAPVPTATPTTQRSSLLGGLTEGGEEGKDLQRYKSAMGRAKKIEEDARKEKADAEKRVAEMQEKLNALTADNERLARERDEAFSRAQKSINGNESAELEQILAIMNDGVEDPDSQYSAEDAKKFLKGVDAITKLRMRGVEEEIGAYKKATAKTRMNAFLGEIERQFPGWANMDRSNDPRWLAFLDTPSPYDDATYGDKAQEALERCDVARLANIIRTFSQSTGVVFSRNGSQDMGADQVRPDGRALSAPVAQTQNNQQAIPRSLAEKFKRAYNSKKWGEFGMTGQEARAFINQIESAEASGLIDETK